MYLSDRDLEHAVETGRLIIDPPPAAYDTTSIDLHLDCVEEARIWDVEAYRRTRLEAGLDARLPIADLTIRLFSHRFARPVPTDPGASDLVYRDGPTIVVRPGGFFLWQTRETVGTPETDSELICFIDGRSSSARVGLTVHMTAPTIHAGWWGKVTFEIANLGPFEIALAEGDAISQIVVATISSPPSKRKREKGISIGQQNVGGAPGS